MTTDEKRQHLVKMCNSVIRCKKCPLGYVPMQECGSVTFRLMPDEEINRIFAMVPIKVKIRKVKI